MKKRGIPPRLPGSSWTMQEAAAFLRVSYDTLKAAVDAGQIKRIPLGAHRWAISDSEVQRVNREGFTLAAVEQPALAMVS
jgi:excisionase family DNA binding protein